MLGTCYRVELVSQSRKRSWGDTFEDTAQSSTGNAASSSGQSTTSSISELIDQQKKEQLAAKQRAKEEQQQIVKAKQPAVKMIASLTGLKSQLKAEKIPASFMTSNPIDDALASLRDALSAMESGFSSEKADQVRAKTVSASSVMKAMKAFT